MVLQTLEFPFEGYIFELSVEYHSVGNCIMLDEVIVKNDMAPMNVNKQHYYHMLYTLNEKIYYGKLDSEIRMIIINELNYNPICYDARKIKMIILGIVLIAIIIFVIPR